MAANNKDARKAFNKKASTNKGGKGSFGYKRRPNSNRSSTMENPNTALGKFTTQFKTASQSLVFPEASMSMQALGNPVQCPGQDNFFDAWNYIFKQAGTGYDAPEVKAARPNAKRIPNAMCIEVCPYFGATAAQTDWGTMSDPLQIAAVNLKQFIDTSYGTVTSYDSQDLMLYLFAIEAVFPMIAEIKRNFRLAVTYQTGEYPQFLPKGMFTLLRLCNYNGEYAHGEGAAYAARVLRSTIDEFNQIIFSFNHLPIPPEILAFGYNDDLFECIYTDTPDTTTAQMYIFRQSEYWTYEENNTDDPEVSWPALVPHSLDEALTLPQMVEILREMVDKITALQTSSTAMIQNLYNAYGSKDLYKVKTFEESDLVPIELRYDENMLTAINNMALMPSNRVSITPIVANPERNRVEGHVYQIDHRNKTMINFPLQFHKPYSDVTKQDIGWALRLHPSLRTYKTITSQDPETPNLQTQITCLTADGYTGFAIPRFATIVTLGDDGVLATNVIHPDNNGWMYVSTDFTASPIPSSATEEGEHTLNVLAYIGKRDVEVTYRLEDIRMFWTYMTGLLYGSDLNRNFTGTRLK